MSVKSVLQLIMLLLIVIIIGGIYFIYFYSSPLDQTKKEIKNIKIDNNFKDENLSKEEEMLGVSEVEVSNLSNSLKNKSKNFLNEDSNEKNNEIQNAFEKSDNNQSNLTKKIEYITKNRNGDTYKIYAEFGKTNEKNSDILDLEKIDGIVTLADNSNIYITSDFANYNYKNQNAKFYGNVVIKYNDRIVESDNFDLIIKDNIAEAYNNVVIKDNETFMSAQNIIINLLTKDININSKKKVKIKKINGIN